MNIAVNQILSNFSKELSEEAQLVKNALEKHGLETPMVESDLSAQQKYEKLKKCFKEVMETLALDLNDDSLSETPHRIAKMYVSEIFEGLDYTNFPKISVIENKMNVDEMVKVGNISFTSTCEHHFVTIDGVANVAYIPKNKIIGLSKINRIVRFFSQRPQVQERLTQQILVALQTLLDTDDVAISMNAVHYCVKSRGVMDSTSTTTTTSLGGIFKSDDKTRHEFLSKI